MQKNTNDPINAVVSKIEDASSILVAVSKEPTMDELSAALGLTAMLDGMGKHATAIYSGEVPDSLQFLGPEKIFEKDTNSLQDFIIALNKDKADHLRYKIDGDYVKIFITPYRTTIDENDFEFSHGDFNIDLVITLGVPEADDLDAALYDHGKILHDSDSINMTDNIPGKFGEIQWADPSTSSVSEMVANLAFALRDKVKMTKTVATALLTGIVANTSRFLNERTTPKTMDVAAKLMQAGANQQLISSNLEDALSEGGLTISKEEPEEEHSGELNINNDISAEQQLDQMISQPQTDVMTELQQASEQTLPEPAPEPAPEPVFEQTPPEPVSEPAYEMPKDYGQMMEEALAEPLPNPAAQAAPTAPTGPELNHIPEMDYVPHVATTPVEAPKMGNEFLTTQPGTGPVNMMPQMQPVQPVQLEQPMPTVAPVQAAPTAEMPLPQSDVQLPPPPIPPVSSAPIMPESSSAEQMQIPTQTPEMPTVAQPINSVQPGQTVSQLEQASDPGAFKIPGM